MVMNNYGFNPMSMYGAFNPYGMSFGIPQQGGVQGLGGLFGGYNPSAGTNPYHYQSFLGQIGSLFSNANMPSGGR